MDRARKRKLTNKYLLIKLKQQKFVKRWNTSKSYKTSKLFKSGLNKYIHIFRPVFMAYDITNNNIIGHPVYIDIKDICYGKTSIEDFQTKYADILNKEA